VDLAPKSGNEGSRDHRNLDLVEGGPPKIREKGLLEKGGHNKGRKESFGAATLVSRMFSKENREKGGCKGAKETGRKKIAYRATRSDQEASRR